mmetsp:Transcript_62716/g.183446  ORF Transcript_62716/g.183446 Transcript_62716/m.183446 type:complete len:433 (+) Transcript_62716:252-1550(+)
MLLKGLIQYCRVARVCGRAQAGNQGVALVLDSLLCRLNQYVHLVPVDLTHVHDPACCPVHGLPLELLRCRKPQWMECPGDAGRDRQEGRVVGRAGAEPSDTGHTRRTAGGWPVKLLHVNRVGAVERDRTFPIPLDLGGGREAVGRAEGAGLQTLRHVVLGPRIPIPVPLHEVTVRHGLVGLQRPRIHRLVPDVLVLIRKGDGGCRQAEGTPHAPPGVVLVRVLAAGIHPGEVERLALLPPILAFSDAEDVGRQDVVVLVRSVHFTDGEHVCHHGHIRVRQALGCPNGAGACWVREDLECPSLLRVSHDERLPRPFEGVRRAIEAVLRGKVAHELHGLAGGRGPLHSQLRERVNAHQSHAHLPAGLASDGGARSTGPKHGTAGGLAHGDAVLVDDAVGVVLVAEGVRHLVYEAYRLVHIWPCVIVGLVIRTKR